MNRGDIRWRGYWSALPTPFDAGGEIDEVALRRVVRLFLDGGVHGLLVNGSTGEWLTQSIEERKHVAEIVIDEVRAAVPVVVAVTAARPVWANSLADHAMANGADSILATVAPGLRLTPAETLRYFQDVLVEQGYPAWIYNFPSEADVVIDTAMIERLCKYPNIVAVKQSTSDLDELDRTVSAVGGIVRVFGSMISRRGIRAHQEGRAPHGHFGSGMLLGRHYSDFFHHLWEGEYSAAEHIADLHDALMGALRNNPTDEYNWKVGGLHGALKAAMSLSGQPAGFPRLPKLPVSDPSALSLLRTTLADLDLAPSAD